MACIQAKVTLLKQSIINVGMICAVGDSGYTSFIEKDGQQFFDSDNQKVKVLNDKKKN